MSLLESNYSQTGKRAAVGLEELDSDTRSFVLWKPTSLNKKVYIQRTILISSWKKIFEVIKIFSLGYENN
jgi:hypothetical protein